MTAVNVSFDAKVTLTVLNGYLAAAGTLLCDPIAKVTEVTRRTFCECRSASHAVGGAGAGKTSQFTVSSDRHVRSTKQRIFTAHPNFDEVLSFVVPAIDGDRDASMSAPSSASLSATERFLMIDIVDSAGSFFGQATCPFSIDRPSKGEQRLMLSPRFCNLEDHPTFLDDMRTLDKYGLDDFGFINVQWEVAMLPRGGSVIDDAVANKKFVPPPLPVGVVVKANWIPSSAAGSTIVDGGNATGSLNPSLQHAMMFSTTVEFGDGHTFRLENKTPLFLGLTSLDLLNFATFACTVQKGHHGSSVTSRVVLPIQPPHADTWDRDFTYCVPLYADDVEDMQGLLIANLRLLPKPVDGPLPSCKDGALCPRINDPKHQGIASHPLADWGRPLPDCPVGAYQPLLWESEAHIARATERRWKRDCVRGAKPTPDHVRHLFEALLGRVPLDANIAQLASSFFNKAANIVTTADLQQLLLAVLFNTDDLPLKEAARFAFVAMRREAERAVKLQDVVFILEHSLFGRSVDMSIGEIERRVINIFGPLTVQTSASLTTAATTTPLYCTFDEYTLYLVNHIPLWFDLGASLQFAVGAGRAERTVSPMGQFTGSTGNAMEATIASIAPSGPQAVAAAAAQPTAALQGGQPSTQAELWRVFTVRVIKTGRPFSVTAHVNDSIADVMKMVEDSATIPASRQKWVFHGLPIDPRRKVLDVFSKPPNAEISIVEKEELLKLIFVLREKNRKWECEFVATEKVLKLRAFVQQKSMIPLSRCVMTYCGNVMQDRHSIDHYKLVDGSIIEVSQQ